MKIFVLLAICAIGLADTVCGPSYDKLVDPRGNALSLDTPFIASVELGARKAMVFRPIESDIRELITRLESQGVRDQSMLTVAYWQETRCRIVNNRCTGVCPTQDGKKLRCLADRDPGDPTPPPNPPPDHKKKKHGKNDGKPVSMQVSALRCRCLP